jgi:hypothetical protein
MAQLQLEVLGAYEYSRGKVEEKYQVPFVLASPRTGFEIGAYVKLRSNFLYFFQ